MNIVVLKGNLTRDPELKNVGDNNTAVVNFTIAVNRAYKRADGTKDQEVTYVDCEAWDSGGKAIHDYVKKGDPILVQGALKLDSWETDGQKRTKLKVRVSKFEMLWRAPANSGSNNSSAANNSSDSSSNDSDLGADAGADDIPF